MDDLPQFHNIEQGAGDPLVAPVSRDEIDRHRRRVYESYEHFLRRRLELLNAQRAQQWSRNYDSTDAYLRSVEPMRERLKQMLGFWVEPGERSPLAVSSRQQVAAEREFDAFRFELEILDGVSTYAVELVPRTPGPHPGLIAQHGYGGTPELICGFCSTANADDFSYRSLGIRAVRRGFHVIAPLHPTSYGTSDDTMLTPPPGFESQTFCYGKNRLHRLAIMGKGTLFGLDMLACSRAVDVLQQCDGVDPSRIGMYGLSQGGQSALFLPALDTRIAASVSSAFFNSRLAKLIGPCRALCYLASHEEDKFFSEVVGCFSDCDLVSLIAPRAFAVEAGELDLSVDFEGAWREFADARVHHQRLGIGHRIEFIGHHQGHISATARAFDFLEKHLGIPEAR